MASQIALTHPNGLHATGYIGFSWTSLFFGGIPALFRGDWLGFFAYFGLVVISAFATAGIATVVIWLVWPFFYNRWHARRLVERGYQITGSAGSIQDAKARVLG
jgi:membrane protein implicated in regulation of membrane protease activity